jgi:hypothetical protein
MLEPVSPTSADSAARPQVAEGAVPPLSETAQRWVAGWAVGGVVLLLGEAIARLGLRAWQTLMDGLTPQAIWAALGLTLLFAYGEGYRALQLRFAPRVVTRAFTIDGHNRMHVVLAPLVALSLLVAERHAQLRAFVAVGLIVAAALAVSALPHPWRGIIDGAVAVALSWGVIALFVRFRQELRRRGPKAPET